MVKRSFVLGLLFGLLLAGCGGFAFKYYGLEGISYSEGRLLGPKPELDKPFSDCAPTAKERHPCVIMFTPEFRAFKTDYEDTKQKLSDCQRAAGSDG